MGNVCEQSRPHSPDGSRRTSEWEHLVVQDLAREMVLPIYLMKDERESVCTCMMCVNKRNNVPAVAPAADKIDNAQLMSSYLST